ncbi:hypothetical protein BCR26_17700 [Enterococcus rivorum]|uniref:Uncharacterized protein n=1 Tax=Enterococcus rivorum TaxID=762845 RepID=A0A1E5KT96_9ENTE|nr:hypothetical protein BCR26_17700 [Enterococcus rivorum]
MSPKVEILTTLNMGLGTLFVVFLFFNFFVLFTKVYFEENNYNLTIQEYSQKFTEISSILFVLLIIFLFSGYYYDILYRTKKGRLKKITDTDKKNNEKIKTYAGIGALIGILLARLISGGLFLPIISLIFSYALSFFLPRTFILAYLKIRFPNTFLRHK